MKKLIAKNVPRETHENYESCKECHLYGVVDQNTFMTDNGLETFKSHGCQSTWFVIPESEINVVSRNCPFLSIEEIFNLSGIDIYENDNIHL